MIVLKFGGSSISNETRINEVIKIILSIKEKKVVVFSAIYGTTNCLYNICYLKNKEDIAQAKLDIEKLHKYYVNFTNKLFANHEKKYVVIKFIENIFNEIESVILKSALKLTLNTINEIVAYGEILSTNIIHQYLLSKNIDNVLLNALDFMQLNKEREPDVLTSKEKLTSIFSNYNNSDIFITQGFICRDSENNIDNLGRGGSDYSASIIGSILNAKEIQIWTDVDGIYNNDPRYIKETHPLHQLNFEEAAELAYFGAKVLHPASILPAKNANIPVIVKNTLNPSSNGTIITNSPPNEGIKAIAAKDNITMIQILSYRMLLAYGFLHAIFEIFNKYKTPIDMITTSEVAVSVTIDKTDFLEPIIHELNKIAQTTIHSNQTIIAIVGYIPKNKPGYLFQITNALKDIPINMIAYGGSDYNISLLVDSKYKINALEKLNNHLFHFNAYSNIYVQS
ncbi:MAG: aspartate kinase [Bacteroidales bacterium]|nr:aspartate kinase [Bacteroidales bacterium]